MKKTQGKDALRNIRKQTVSYLSVVVIAMLAVLAYLGINFAAEAIGNNGDEFYDACNFRDVQIISTKLITQDDIEAIRAVNGVSDVEGTLRTDAQVFTENSTTDVMVVSLTGRINVVQVIEGRLPASANECVIEKTVDEDTGLGVGDTIEVLNPKGGAPDYLKGTEYVITGIVYHPDHACWPLMSPGARYVLVLPEAFDNEALENCFMTAEVTIDGALGINRFSKKYNKHVSGTVDALEALSDQRELLRTEDIQERYRSGIEDGQNSLDDAASELSDARSQLDDNWKIYDDGVAELKDAKDQLGESQKKLADAEAELKNAKDQLDDAKNKLDSGKAELDKAWAELEEGRAKLDQAEAELEDARKQLESGYSQIEESGSLIRCSLKDAVTDVLGSDIADMIDWSESSNGIDVDDPDASAAVLPITGDITVDLNRSMKSNIFSLIDSLGIPEEDLVEAYEKTTGRIIDLSDGRPVIQIIVDTVYEEYVGIDDRYEELASAARTWDSGHSEYIEGLNAYNEAKEKYDDGVYQYYAAFEEYQDKKAQYDEGLAEYEAGLAEYNDGLTAYEEGKKQYADGEKQLSDAYAELEDGESRYSEGIAEYNEGETELSKAKADLESQDPCRWVVLDAAGNAGFRCIDNSRNNVSNLGGTFALIFILVGALVIYATVGRIVDEQRRLVGATKALGLYNREILAKYLIFGVTGTVAGMILGITGGYYAIQSIVLSIYGRYYIFGAGSKAFDLIMTSAVFIGGILLSGLTVWFACTNLMKSSAIVLMQDSVPDVRKKRKKTNPKRRTGKGSLYGNLIILNMLTDRKRVAVTVVSIAGCCSLLVAGMTMNFAIKKTIDEEFSGIEKYDLKIVFDPSATENAGSEIESILQEEGASNICLSDRITYYDSEGKLNICELLCGDVEKLNGYFIRKDPGSGSVINGTGDGIWIHAQMSKLDKLDPGDEITLYNSAMNPYSSTVSGVFEVRAGWFCVMSRDAYIRTFGEEPVYNTFLIGLNGADSKSIISRVSSVRGFMEYTDTKERYSEIKDLAAVMDYLSLLFIGIAGMMAYFILLNLVNMYINQKKKELTIMRINGFTVKETIRYVSLELIVCTALGIVTGILSGSLLGYRIITLLEGWDFHIIKTVQPGAWGVAALITCIFTALISAWALRKVRHLKLTDMETS